MDQSPVSILFLNKPFGEESTMVMRPFPGSSPLIN